MGGWYIQLPGLIEAVTGADNYSGRAIMSGFITHWPLTRV